MFHSGLSPFERIAPRPHSVSRDAGRDENATSRCQGVGDPSRFRQCARSCQPENCLRLSWNCNFPALACRVRYQLCPSLMARAQPSKENVMSQARLTQPAKSRRRVENSATVFRFFCACYIHPHALRRMESASFTGRPATQIPRWCCCYTGSQHRLSCSANSFRVSPATTG